MTKYERKYIGWYLRENAKKIALILVIFFMAIPFFSIIAPSRYMEDYFQGPMVLQNITLAICGIALAYGMAIYNFRHLMNKRAATMYLAMPITKGRFFILQYAIGAVLVFVLPLIMYIIAMFLDAGTYTNLNIYLLYGFYGSILHVVMYTFFVFLVMKCRNLWDAFLINLGHIILPLLVSVGFYAMISNVLSSTLVSFVTSVNEIIPAITILELVSIPTAIFNFGAGLNEATYSAYYTKGNLWEQLLEHDGISLWILVFWVVVAILLFRLALKAYKKRACEESETRTTAYICYPFLSLMVTISLLLTDARSFVGGGLDFFVSLPMLIVTFVIYLVMNFFARRKIAVTKQMVFSFVGVIVFVFILNYACISTNGFGRIHEFPIKEDITSITVRVSYEIQSTDNVITFENPRYQSISGKKFMFMDMQSPSEDKDLIKRIYDLQHDIVSESAGDYVNYAGANIYIDYGMSNGIIISRGYSIPSDLIVTTINPLLGDLVDANLCGDLQSLEMNINEDAMVPSE